MRRAVLPLWLLIWSAFFGALPARAESTPTGFLNKTLLLDGKSYPYVVYVPRGYSPEKKWPVILFLHGSGERGDDGLKQTQVGLGGAVRMHPERFPALVVLPQCPAGERWEGKPAEAALKAVDRTVQEYNGDPRRLYLTGLSMGGSGSWLMAAQHPGKFAAVAPLCGRGDVASVPEKLKTAPVWVFVGDADRAETVQNARDMVAALKAAGSTLVRYTEYPGVGHNCWDTAYGTKEWAEWLFAQRLP